MTASQTAIEEAVARLQIEDLLARLARWVDRRDQEKIAECYVENSLDEHGEFTGTGRQFAEWICQQNERADVIRFMHHQLGQSVYDFDLAGDAARVETYYVFHAQLEPGRIYASCGRYLDHLRRVDGRWLLGHRRVVSEWNGTMATADGGPGDQYIQATRDRTDPLYGFLAEPAPGVSGRRAQGTSNRRDQ